MARPAPQRPSERPGGSGTAADTPAEDDRRLTPAAQRALAEAEARRARREAADGSQAPEVEGRDGPDPVRYGDWEMGGRAVDF